MQIENLRVPPLNTTLMAEYCPHVRPWDQGPRAW